MTMGRETIYVYRMPMWTEFVPKVLFHFLLYICIENSYNHRIFLRNRKLNEWMWKCQHCCKLWIYWWMSVILFVLFLGSAIVHFNQRGSVKYVFSIQVEPLSIELWLCSTTLPAWIPVQKWRFLLPFLKSKGIKNSSNSCMVRNEDQVS